MELGTGQGIHVNKPKDHQVNRMILAYAVGLPAVPPLNGVEEYIIQFLVLYTYALHITKKGSWTKKNTNIIMKTNTLPISNKLNSTINKCTYFKAAPLCSEISK